MLRSRPANVSEPSGQEDGSDLVTVFSARNFFSVINFLHVLQKLTKRKTHRILLLVQYKSSVSDCSMDAPMQIDY